MRVLEETSPSHEEVAEVIQSVIGAIRDLKEKLETKITKVDDFAFKEIEKVSVFLDGEVGKLNQKIEDNLNTVIKNIDTNLEKIKGSIPEKADLTEVYDKIKDVEKKIPAIPDEITGEAVANKLESLPEDKKLLISAIKGLEGELKRIEGTARTRGLLGGVRRVFQPYVDDFSGSTDGSTKIFYLSREPLKTGAVMVYGTDFPVILRPTIDFTIEAKKLTLTDEVAAPSSGASLICTYFA